MYGHYAGTWQILNLMLLFFFLKFTGGGLRYFVTSLFTFVIWLLYFVPATCLATADFKSWIAEPFDPKDVLPLLLLLTPGLYFFAAAAWRLRRRCYLLKHTPWACCKTLPFVVEDTKFGSVRPLTVAPDNNGRIALTMMDGYTSSTEDRTIGYINPSVICGPNKTLQLIKEKTTDHGVVYKIGKEHCSEHVL